MSLNEKMPFEPSRQALILVVDDLHGNIQVICNVLARYNYKFATASSGHQALAFLEKRVPDLILLDIMMPEMDGFEVCRLVKSNPRTKDIPIIFLTSKSEADDKVTGFEIGGSDYITKPFEPAVLIARVKNCLQLKFAVDTIKRQNDLLRESLRNRTEQLIISERQFTYGQLIKNSINDLEYIFSQTAEICESLKSGMKEIDADEVDSEQFKSCRNQMSYIIGEFEKNIKNASVKLNNITQTLIAHDIKNGTDKLELTDLNKIVAEGLNLLESEPLFKYIINKDIKLAGEEIPINIIPREVIQIILTFIALALNDFVELDDATIFIRTIKEDEYAKLVIGNNAASKTEEEIRGLFDPLYELDKLNTNEDLKSPAGINQNLYMMQELLKPYRGTIEIVNRGDAGTDYIAKIPLYR